MFILSLSPTHTAAGGCDWFGNQVTALPLSAFQKQHTHAHTHTHTHTCSSNRRLAYRHTHLNVGNGAKTTNKHGMNGPSQSDPSLAEFNEILAISVGNVGDASKCKTYIFHPNSEQRSFQGPNVPGPDLMDTLGVCMRKISREMGKTCGSVCRVCYVRGVSADIRPAGFIQHLP